MIREKIEDLRRRLEYHNYKYYVENAPEISDFEFDAMMRELLELEREHPEYADPNSPSVRVGSDLTEEFRSVAHRFPMLSLGNTYSLDELHEFIARIERETGPTELVCELKFDGTAISLTYEHGRLLRAVTRGDGTQGDDVTANIRTIRTVPLRLRGDDWPDYFEIRGEVLMPYASFDRLNAEREANGEQLFANPRNAAAGTLKQQSSAVVARRGLYCTLYQLAGENLPFDNHWESLQQARKWGFNISDRMRICRSTAEVDDYIAYWDQERRRLPFPTDGVVIKVNSFAERRRLGMTAKAPKWAVAYKFKAEQALTRLESVDFQVGRTGAITPVANLDPVVLAGTTVRRATLHNAEQIALLDIRLCDMVYVEKGGEIIPKITGVDLASRPADSRPFEYITRCPECGTPLVRYEGEAKHYCPNQSGCRPQIIGRIVHFIRRKAMDIEGLGEETVELLYENGLVRNPADLYDLRAEQLAPLPRLGEKSAENIIRSIRASVEVPLRRVLFALGIRFVGETTAKYLAEHFRSLEAVMHATREELVEADEVGGKIADAIIEYFADAENLEIIRRLQAAGVRTEAEERLLASDSLAGRTFVISGKFADHSRDELKELIELHGGRNLAAVSGNVDYLVAGENMGPAKLRKAEKLGIRIISEQEFAAMIRGEALPSAAEASPEEGNPEERTAESDGNPTEELPERDQDVPAERMKEPAGGAEKSRPETAGGELSPGIRKEKLPAGHPAGKLSADDAEQPDQTGPTEGRGTSETDPISQKSCRRANKAEQPDRTATAEGPDTSETNPAPQKSRRQANKAEQPDRTASAEGRGTSGTNPAPQQSRRWADKAEQPDRTAPAEGRGTSGTNPAPQQSRRRAERSESDDPAEHPEADKARQGELF